LLIDGFSYGAMGGTFAFFPGLKSPIDAPSRLRWLALQPGFHPQPYRQLAKVLRENGDEPGAKRVLIAAEDERYRQYGWAGAILGGFLKKTIGYGHRPLLTIGWMIGVVAIGWVMVALGKRAGVMRLTWPETTPPPAGDPGQRPWRAAGGYLGGFVGGGNPFLPNSCTRWASGCAPARTGATAGGARRLHR